MNHSDFRRIKKEEYGATFLSRKGNNKYIGNACFFCSFFAGLIEAKPEEYEILSLKYEDFLETGNWSSDASGKMVDTFYNAENIHRLASHFKVIIIVYTELAPDVVYTAGYNRFGSEGPVINIVKLLNRAHFNLMSWNDVALDLEVVSAARKKLEKQIKKDREYAIALEKQLIGAATQEMLDERYAREVEENLQKELLQIEADAKYAASLATSVV